MAHRQNSRGSPASFSNRNTAAKMINWIGRLLCMLCQDISKNVLITATMIMLRLCHRWVHTSWVDPLTNHGADIANHIGQNLCRGTMQIHRERMKCISVCIMNLVINVSCIAPMLSFITWAKLWRDPEHGSFACWKTIVNSHCGEGNECRFDFINR